MFSKVKPVPQSWSLKFSELSICLLANLSIQFSSSVVSDSATPWTAVCQASLSITNSWTLLKLMSSWWAIQPSHPLLSPSPTLNLSQHQGLFQWVSSSHQVAKVLGVSASVSVLAMNIQDWFPVGWTGWISLQSKGLSSLPQCHSSKASILQRSAFCMVQLSHTHMTTGKTIALTRWTFVGKEMSMLLNMLSKLVIAFLPRSKRLLISWLQSPSAVVLEPQKIVCHCFHCFPIYFPWSDGTGCNDLHIFNVLNQPFHSPLSPSSRGSFSSSSLSGIRVVSSANLRLLVILPEILIPACASTSPAFHMMFFAYKLNKQSDSIPDILLSRFGTSLLFHVQL